MAKKKVHTLVGLLLDETGSMLSVKSETVSGLEEYINTLKKDGVNVRFTQACFNSASPFRIVYDDVPMEDVEPPTMADYRPNYMTPLYDAIGSMVKHMDSARKKFKAEKKGKVQVLIAIMTDGEENDSKEFTRDKIFELVEAKQKKGWSFAFLGADIDSYAVGTQIGIDPKNILNYNKVETQTAMRAVASSTVSYTTGGKTADNLFEDVEDSDAVWRSS